MYGGEMMRASLEGRNEMVGTLIDRFGTEISIIPKDESHFTAYVDVIVSRHFIGWIIALGDGIRITGPDYLVHLMQDEANRLSNSYLSPENR